MYLIVSFHFFRYFFLFFFPRHPFNLLRVRVFRRSSLRGDSDDEVGSVNFHLHHLIDASPLSGTFSLYKGHHLAGEITLDLSFKYGAFGYGHSSQLRLTKPAEAYLAGSQYPRLDPPLDRYISSRRRK